MVSLTQCPGFLGAPVGGESLFSIFFVCKWKKKTFMVLFHGFELRETAIFIILRLKLRAKHHCPWF